MYKVGHPGNMDTDNKTLESTQIRLFLSVQEFEGYSHIDFEILRFLELCPHTRIFLDLFLYVFLAVLLSLNLGDFYSSFFERSSLKQSYFVKVDNASQKLVRKQQNFTLLLYVISLRRVLLTRI